MPKGKILSVEDYGSVWTLYYETPKGKIGQINFDWRMLANFYEGTSGRDFYNDYNFGQGRKSISDYFIGKTISIGDKDGSEYVRLEC
jgi:hypothetical protein